MSYKKCYDQKLESKESERHVEVHDWLAKVRGWDIKDYTQHVKCLDVITLVQTVV